MDEEIQRAIWAGDTDTLYTIASCRCCCHEHTFANCPARKWGACRGQDTPDYKGWARFYQETRGMSEEVFFNTAPVFPLSV